MVRAQWRQRGTPRRASPPRVGPESFFSPSSLSIPHVYLSMLGDCDFCRPPFFLEYHAFISSNFALQKRQYEYMKESHVPTSLFCEGLSSFFSPFFLLHILWIHVSSWKNRVPLSCFEEKDNVWPLSHATKSLLKILFHP
ncbi:hypothetical protein EUGRSUZ_A01189 [Eucalyptus grandis]|uniref:Uncharacterized protein n=2 Tax=Eucalyptus grandis TaxID=71139 RepID=A0ACC3M2W9_EUCGR|nr:hypothetical protein EUGRSUZ_A01189 [Eucalyptus grandis]